MNDTTQKIAVEATRELAIALFNDETDSRAGTILAHIQSAIEKATEQKDETIAIYEKRWLEAEARYKSRAAHASEPIPCKAGLIHWKQEHADLCTICHPELYKPAHASEGKCITCGKPKASNWTGECPECEQNAIKKFSAAHASEQGAERKALELILARCQHGRPTPYAFTDIIHWCETALSQRPTPATE